jgi:hypothetical protein
MAQGRGKEHKIFPQSHDAQKAHQQDHSPGGQPRQLNQGALQNRGGAAQILPRPPHGTSAGQNGSNQKGHQTHTSFSHTRAECSPNSTHHPRRGRPSSKSHASRKSPRSGWVHRGFFHHCWDLVRQDVWEVVEESRASGLVLPALNATFLTLIPKEERVTNPKQFRPIALCNVIYKVITKVIATRLKPILPFLISKEQSGYVEGRQIMDSVILAHEVIHSLKTSRTPGMLIKLDLSKAFDRASWHYIRAVLDSFGFDQDWINWIMNLTSSTFFSILVNGVPSKPFTPSRGIRQGDPLSPFCLYS